MRELNGGHLYFYLTEKGTPFRVDDGRTIPVQLKKDDPSNFSDIFGAKGMLAAAKALNDSEATQEALAYMRQTEANLLTGRFISDQQTLDPRFPITSVPGRQAQGPLMIQLGAMALRMKIAPQADDIAIGLALLRYLFNRHTCFERGNLQPGDYWEFVDEVGNPWLDAKKRLIADPGHALELTGLGMKWFKEVQQSNLATKEQMEELQQHQKSLFQIFVRNFEIGFQPEQGGICKSFDLIHNRQSMVTCRGGVCQRRCGRHCFSTATAGMKSSERKLLRFIACAIMLLSRTMCGKIDI